jgi:erythromycin esterase
VKLHDEMTGAVRSGAVDLKMPKDLEPLIDKISRSKIVMLGEASHGTHEFYEWRRIISEWLMVKHGFSFIAVEGDWPACSRLNNFIHGDSSEDAVTALHSFNRWPTWMWANSDIVRLADWMRTHNQTGPKKPISFYGLDVYSLFESVEAVIQQLEKINPFLARRARIRYGCFDSFHRDEKAYARSLIDFPEGCED